MFLPTSPARAALVCLAAATARHGAPRCSESVEPFAFSDVSCEALRREQQEFVQERDWDQFHTPRSLALALVGEVGEVCELLQWRGDLGAPPGLDNWTEEERMRLGEELSDVLSYVFRLADVGRIDLPAAFLDKLAKNRLKYPAERVRGSAAKYTEYRASSSTRATAPPDAMAAEAEAEASSAAEEAAAEEAAALGESEAGAEELTFEADPAEQGWGVPDRIISAQMRAKARAEALLAAKQRGGDAGPPDGGGGMAAEAGAEAAAGAEVEAGLDERAAASSASQGGERVARKPSARERAQSRVEAQLAAERAGGVSSTSNATVLTWGDAGAEAQEGEGGGGVELDSLDDLWSFMEYDGKPPDF